MLLTIQKASEVLALYDHTHSEWGFREVAEKLSLMCTPIYRFLSSQVEYRTATINAAKLISKRLGYSGW